MIGSGAIGEWALGEDEADGAWVQVGTAEAVAETYPTSFMSGSVAPGTAESDGGSYAPRVAAGSSAHPVDENAAVEVYTPTVGSGASVHADGAIAEAEANAPAGLSGATVFPEGIAAEASASTPLASGGARSAPDYASGTATTYDANSFTAGAVVAPVEVVTFHETGGAIGEGAIGEFGIGEGDDNEQVRRTTMRALALVYAPRVASGAAVIVPLAPVEAEAFDPEADARARNIRMFAIAS